MAITKDFPYTIGDTVYLGYRTTGGKGEPYWLQGEYIGVLKDKHFFQDTYGYLWIFVWENGQLQAFTESYACPDGVLNLYVKGFKENNTCV